MAIKRGTTKAFNGKRVIDIFNYVTGLGAITNINCKSIAISNPIAVTVAYEQLMELQKEMDAVSIDILDIDIENVLEPSREKNEVEFFIANANKVSVISTYYKMYKRMKEMESLEEVYPLAERRERKEQLELEINKKVYTNDKLHKINPSLANKEEKVIQGLKAELDSIVETLDFPSPEEIRLGLYSVAIVFIEQTKAIIENHITYLSGVVEELS